MEALPHCCDGVPAKLSQCRNDVYNCKCCDEAKCTNKTGNIEEEVNAKQPGERFQMDFGFIKGEKDELKILESYNGYSAYLIILDKKTRYMWIFLCKNKIPPTKTVEKFLKKAWYNRRLRK